MKQPRLAALLSALAALLVLRSWAPPGGGTSVDVSTAVVRPSEAAAIPPSPVASTPHGVDLSAGTRELDAIEPRNAFAVRTPFVPPPTPARVAAAPPPFVGAPAPLSPPPASPPPFQVIGSWRDDAGASVFISSPRGVLQGRVGDVLLSEYRVAQITPQQVMLKHLPSNRDVPLAVPAAAGISLSLPK